MQDLISLIIPSLTEVMNSLGVKGDFWEKMLGESREKAHADVSLPCFPLAKQLGMSPENIAQEISESLDSDSFTCASAGGYVNFKASQEWLAQHVLSEQMPRGNEEVLIEHTSANPNGPFHVGRARNAILGDTLVRLHRLHGNRVRAEYYVDDMGKQVAILAWALDNLSEQEVGAIEVDSKWAGKPDHERVRYYQAAQAMRDSHPNMDVEIGELVHASEHGDEETLAAFEAAYQPVLDGMLQTLARLGIEFDEFTKESKFVVDGSVTNIMESFEQLDIHGVADNGAMYLDLGQRGLSGKTEFFYRRGDGTSLYATRDIAYHIWKWQQSSNLINVLGEDHKLQSKQVGLTLNELGHKAPEVAFYSFIKLPEGKMSTRKGNVVFMDDLLEEAALHAAQVLRELRPELNAEQVAQISEAVGVSAVRFNIVKVQPDKGFTFRWEDALSFEGESAPFIMYSHTRACSIAAKVGRDAQDYELPENMNESTMDLLRIMALTPDRLQIAVNEHKPHRFAVHMLELASAYNAFYRDCRVIIDGEVNEFNLALSQKARVMMKQGMQALGVIPLESM